jgi:8-oxo-dGTP diphosphatase
MSESVITVCFSKDRTKVLLVKRRDVPVWVLPGGGSEIDEPLENTATRETFEESGYKVKVSKKVGEYTPINKLTRFTHLFECEILSGKPTISNETKEVKFFDVKNLPKYLPPPYGQWIEDAHLNKKEMITKELSNITYLLFVRYLLTYPILVFRFVLSRMGIYINS